MCQETCKKGGFKIRLKYGVMILSGFFLLSGCAPINHAGGSNPLMEIVRFYQGPLHHLSMVRRGTTSMYPASSNYALEALAKHGPILGWFMTCDRLVRSGRDEMRLSPTIIIHGRPFAYDPVSANDFWWSEKDAP